MDEKVKIAFDRSLKSLEVAELTNNDVGKFFSTLEEDREDANYSFESAKIKAEKDLIKAKKFV